MSGIDASVASSTARHTVYVRGFQDKAELTNLVSAYGATTALNVAHPRHAPRHTRRKSAWVTFEHPSDAARCVAQLATDSVTVEWAKEESRSVQTTPQKQRRQQPQPAQTALRPLSDDSVANLGQSLSALSISTAHPAIPAASSQVINAVQPVASSSSPPLTSTKSTHATTAATPRTATAIAQRVLPSRDAVSQPHPAASTSSPKPMHSIQPATPAPASASSSTSAAANATGTSTSSASLSVAPNIPVPPPLLPPSHPAPAALKPDTNAPPYYEPRHLVSDLSTDSIWSKYVRIERGLPWFFYVYENNNEFIQKRQRRRQRTAEQGNHTTQQLPHNNTPDPWEYDYTFSAFSPRPAHTQCPFTFNPVDRTCWKLIQFLRMYTAHGKLTALKNAAADDEKDSDEFKQIVRQLHADIWCVMYFFSLACFGAQNAGDASRMPSMLNSDSLKKRTPFGCSPAHLRLSVPKSFTNANPNKFNLNKCWYTAADALHNEQHASNSKRVVVDFGGMSNEFRGFLIWKLNQYSVERLQDRGGKRSEEGTFLKELVTKQCMQYRQAGEDGEAAGVHNRNAPSHSA